MNTVIGGTEVDINDDDTIASACVALSQGDLKRIPPNYHSKALLELLAKIRFWYIKSGAQIQLASVGGYSGVSLRDSLDSHSFIGSLFGEPPMRLMSMWSMMQHADSPEEQTLPVFADEPEHVPGPEVLEGDEVPGPPIQDEG